MAEGARLESVYTATYRGFESPPHRHIQERARTEVRAFCLYVSPKPRGDENHRPGFDNWRSQLDRRRACEETARRASAASQSPPLTAIFKKELVQKYGLFAYMYPPNQGGDENHRPGVDNWRSQLDRRRACEETARRASAASQSPPHRHLQERARTKVRAFFSHLTRRLPDDGAIYKRLIRLP